MKLKSILIFVLIVLMLAMLLPLVVFAFQMLEGSFDDTWIGAMIDKM